MRLFITGIVLLLMQIATLAALTPESDANDILDALNNVGKDLKSFSANVALHETDFISGDSSIRTGMAVYEKRPDGDARFRITFLKFTKDDLTKDQRLEYLLEKGWLYDRNYPKKLEDKRQIVRPGEKINLLKLGEGPFPLPIGQPREDVLKQFDVKKISAAKDDPANTVHIQLVPRPNSQFERKFKTIDVWADLTSSMPSRIETIDTNETTKRGTDLNDVRLNVDLTDQHFALPPLPSDWQTTQGAFSE